MNKDCIFCRIISGEFQSDILYQDDEVIALRDINPQAPTHILIMPKAHIPSLAEITMDHQTLVGHLVHVAGDLAKSEGIA
ncbi:MAG: HIT domain-containing protein, partial [Dehalococcoidia bacterium]|nr:HIT domain-containing protein [Dehalococcoidia bacterium]